jgi:hypothetical protein
MRCCVPNYAIYHAAKVLLPKVDHYKFAVELGKLDRQAGLDVGILQKLRPQAGFDPQFVQGEFEDNLELFRAEVQERGEQGRRIFRWLADTASLIVSGALPGWMKRPAV